MPSNADSIPNIAKDWESRLPGSCRHAASKVYPWNASRPKDALLFLLLIAGALAAAFALWMVAWWILRVLGHY